MAAIETAQKRPASCATGTAANRRKKKISTDRFAFTIDEAAQLSSLSRSALYIAVKDGKLRLTKKGRRSLVLRDDLLAYLRGGAAT
jgi:excisionase family DNA binding protein